MDYFEAVYNGFCQRSHHHGHALYQLRRHLSSGSERRIRGRHQPDLTKDQRKRIFRGMHFLYDFPSFRRARLRRSRLPIYPLAVTIGFAPGYDRMVGTGLAIIGSTVGFTSGLMNTFTTGVAPQQIVGLPMFSGIGFRCVGLVVFYIIGLAGLYAYCRKIKKKPGSKPYERGVLKPEQRGPCVRYGRDDAAADSRPSRLPLYHRYPGIRLYPPWLELSADCRHLW